MGMFDTVHWLDKLPISEEMKELGLPDSGWNFQTKSLDCALEEYVVRDGFLFVTKYNKEEWIQGDPSAKSVSDRFPYLERDDPYLQKTTFTGSMRVYESYLDVDGLWDCMTDFECAFIEGKLISVRLSNFTKRDSLPRKTQEEQILKSIALSRSRWYNKYLLHTKIWRSFIWKVHRVLFVTGNFFHNASRKIL